jgi:hypothetical protein
MAAIRKPADTSGFGSVASGRSPVRVFNVVGFLASLRIWF